MHRDNVHPFIWETTSWQETHFISFQPLTEFWTFGDFTGVKTTTHPQNLAGFLPMDHTIDLRRHVVFTIQS